jgi:alkanesulfonate monooxygenase SsuD/methylene tetrahydromethanopterin reductase-like flavin-dependent oxidoreductase (luciferase family)
MAQEAEDAGFDAVMASEHVVLGPGADAKGLMPNPRDYALPGNQDPAMPWPSSLLLLSAIASATATLRLAAAAIIAPLRHPLLLAKALATLDVLSEGRLVVLPTVLARASSTAHWGCCSHTGVLLDEHLVARHVAWGPSPATHTGRFYAFEDVSVEPAPRTEGAPVVGSSTVHDRLLRRMVRYGELSDKDLDRVRRRSRLGAASTSWSSSARTRPLPGRSLAG